jgi:hypothetical protein
MGTIDFRVIWVDPSWTCFPILIATLISSALLAFLSIRWIKLLIWLRAQVAPDRIGKHLVISLIPVSFIGVGIFQCWFGEVLYTDYYGMDSASNMHVGVPVYPLWFVGMLSAVIYIIVCQSRRRTGDPKSHWGGKNGFSWIRRTNQ